MVDINIRGVQKYYGDFRALNGIEIHVKDGEFLALLGPSGCGKTTLLRSIAGLETIEGGDIQIGGVTVSQRGYTMAPEQRQLGMIFQSYALWPHMRVFDNIAYGLRIRKWKKGAIKDRVSQVLDLVGLQGLEARFPSELSGGQMQRVAVARSLAPEPRVLLFDEPLSNLDSKLREKMRFELRQIQERVGTTSVYVTHDQSEAMVMADRIVLLDSGEVVQVGSARDLYQRPINSFAANFLGLSNFLSATVTSAPDSGGFSDLALSERVRIRGYAGSRFSAGQPVMVAVRPEHVRIEPLGPSSSEPGRFEAEVERSVYGGNIADVFLRVDGMEVRSQVLAEELEWISTGDHVLVAFHEQHVRVIDDRPPIRPTVRGSESPDAEAPDDADVSTAVAGPTTSISDA